MKNFKDYIAGDELTLVAFYANWCESCKTMHSDLTDYRRLMGNKVRVLKLNVDAPENASKVAEYGVEAVPTMMFFMKGDLVWRSSEVVSVEGLKQVSDKLLTDRSR